MYLYGTSNEAAHTNGMLTVPMMIKHQKHLPGQELYPVFDANSFEVI